MPSGDRVASFLFVKVKFETLDFVEPLIGFFFTKPTMSVTWIYFNYSLVSLVLRYYKHVSRPLYNVLRCCRLWWAPFTEQWTRTIEHRSYSIYAWQYSLIPIFTHPKITIVQNHTFTNKHLFSGRIAIPRPVGNRENFQLAMDWSMSTRRQRARRNPVFSGNWTDMSEYWQ